MIEMLQKELSPKTAMTVIALPEVDYGSSRIEEWNRVLNTLEDELMKEETKFSLVIVDLSRVRIFGASLIGWLVDFANRLNSFDIQLKVRGDRLGLLKLVGLAGKLG